MRDNRLAMAAVLATALFVAQSWAVDPIPLGDPATQPATQPAPAPDLATELKGMPDGVLLVKTNPDGSFKSLVVKATVDIEDALGAEKGKRLAERDASEECKKALSQWLNENCVFTEASNKTRTIITKGESSKDAAGNVVTLRNQQATEVHVLTDTDGSISQSALRGLIVLQSQVSDDQNSYSLIMGLSQKTLAQSAAVHDILQKTGNSPGGATPAGTAAPNAGSPQNPDKPAPDTKTNPDAKDFQ